MRDCSPARITTLAWAALLAGLAAMWPPPRAAIADDQDAAIQTQKDEAKQRKERYTTWMRDFSKGSAVRVTMPGDDEDTEADLVASPIFRFNTQEITDGGTLAMADDGTLWVWTLDSRPVAVQKVEVCNIGGRLWTICFGSISEGLVTVNWPGERRFRATQPGVKYRPIPGAAAPGDKALTRTAQLKALKSRFTGLMGRFIADEKGAVEGKAITTPLYQYADKDSDVDPSKFTLELQRVKSDAKSSTDEKAVDRPTQYTGTLDWIEPFATKKPQKLNLEISTWARNDRNFIFVCVSPQARDTAIWKQLHTIRDDYLKK